MHNINSKKTPKERRREAKLQDILSVAMDIVIESGIEKLTIHKLADLLDYTPGALYRYYSSKDSIIADLQIQVINSYSSFIVKLFQYCIKIEVENDKAKNLLPLFSIISSYYIFAEKTPQHFHLISSIMANPLPVINDEDAKRVFLEIKNLLSGLSKIISLSQEDNNSDRSDLNQKSILIFSGLQGVLQLNKLSRLDKDLINVKKIYFNLFFDILKGWGIAEEIILDTERIALKIPIESMLEDHFKIIN